MPVFLFTANTAGTFAASHMLFFAPTRRPLLFRVSDTPLSLRVAPRVRSDKFRQIG